MSFPAVLGYNNVAVYGSGSLRGLTGMRLAQGQAVKFGSIYHLGENVNGVSIYDSIMFRESDVVSRVQSGVLVFTLVNQSDIILKEDI